MLPIAIIGAGQAGVALAAKLRVLGCREEIRLFGAEPVLPYQRPPLSKKYLLGEITREQLYLRPENFYENAGIVLQTGSRVVDVDAAEKTIGLEDGKRLACSAIAFCTGAEPIRLGREIGGDLAGVYPVRSIRDSEEMAEAFRPGAHVLIVGGGYIGLEAAAVAASRGLRVTLVEKAQRLLARVACEETAAWFRALHESHGVEIRTGTGLVELRGRAGHVSSAQLDDGDEIAIDFAIVGVGVRPNVALAQSAGVVIGNGIEVDAFGRTSVPGIFAAGDCASFPWKGSRIRLESVPNATEQGKTIALHINGKPKPYNALPWFWSDQYDLKLQMAGLSQGYDQVVIRGDLEHGRELTVFYLKEGRVLSLDCVNRPKDFMIGKKLIESEKQLDTIVLSNDAIDLGTLL